MTAVLAGATVVLQGLPFDEGVIVQSIGRLLGFAIGSAGLSAAAALLFRWYTREKVSLGVTVLLGLSIVALYLNTVGLFAQLLGGTGVSIFELDEVVFNVVAIGVAAFSAPVGRSIGDRIGTDVFAVAGVKELDAEVSRIVRTVGRVTAITLPKVSDIGDIDAYDPVSMERKEEMAERTLLFPNRLTVDELRDRLVERLKDDYRVGHVDVDIDVKGNVEYLAVGSRAAGIGPTLAHGTVAVAVRADPAYAASAGDVVQLWQPGTVETTPDGETVERPPERVVTGELRARTDDIVTVAVDATDAEKLDATVAYRLVSLPAEPQVDREFASLLRSADETMAAVTIKEESELVGETLGSLDVTVAAVRTVDGKVAAIPPRGGRISGGDTLYVIARPEVLRRLEARANLVIDVTPAVETEQVPTN